MGRTAVVYGTGKFVSSCLTDISSFSGKSEKNELPRVSEFHKDLSHYDISAIVIQLLSRMSKIDDHSEFFEPAIEDVTPS